MIEEREFLSLLLVVLDMIMPAMSGAEVYGHLKQQDPAVKVLLCSGYSLDSMVNR